MASVRTAARAQSSRGHRRQRNSLKEIAHACQRANAVAANQSAPHCWSAPAVLRCATMKAKTTWLVAAFLAACLARAADERIAVSELPPPVQKALESWKAQGPVKEVTRRTVDGRTVYDVEIEKNNAPNPRLRLAQDGTLLRDPTTVTTDIASGGAFVVAPEYAEMSALTYNPPPRLEDLPPAVQQTVRREAAGRELADIDRETWGGQPAYEIEFKQSGLNTRIYVAEDGALLRDERPRRSLKSFFLGTQLEDTPAAVQETIRRIAGEREILDIDRKLTNRQPVYRVEIRGPSGTQELQIGEDGKVLFDSRATGQRRG